MNALRKLEKGGFRFELLPDGRLHYQDMWPSAGSRHWPRRCWPKSSL